MTDTMRSYYRKDFPLVTLDRSGSSVLNEKLRGMS